MITLLALWSVGAVNAATAMSAPVAARPHMPSVTVSPAEIVLGADTAQDAVVRISTSPKQGSAGESSAPEDWVLHATAGSFGPLRRVAPGVFEATLHPPKKRYPRFCIISAVDTAPTRRGLPPAIATTKLSYRARVELSGNTEARARMTVTLGGRRYGPVRTDAHGAFRLPVVVHPGEAWARAVSTDALGNAASSQIDLYLPKMQRLHMFTWPLHVVADGSSEAWVFLTAVDAAGKPSSGPVSIDVTQGEVGSVEAPTSGVMRARFVAPKGFEKDVVVVTARLRSKANRVAVQIGLWAGAPTATSFAVSPDPIPADGSTPGVVTLSLKDAHGNPAAGHRVYASDESGMATLMPARARPDGNPSAVHELTLAPRQAIGKEPFVAHIATFSPRCPGARQRHGSRVDFRGFSCAPETAPVGISEASGETLVPATRPGAMSDAAGQGSAGTTSPGEVRHTLIWRLPTAVDLRLSVIEGSAGKVLLLLTATGVDAPLQRIDLATTHGGLSFEHSAAVTVGDVQKLRLVLTRGATESSDAMVIATDRATGVAAILRVPAGAFK